MGIGDGHIGVGGGILITTGAGALIITEGGGIITIMVGCGHPVTDGDTHGLHGRIQDLM